MEEQKKRKNVLEHLEQQRKIVDSIGTIVPIIICIIFLSAAMSEYIADVNVNDSLYIGCVVVYFSNYIFIDFYCNTIIENKKNNEMQRLKVATIKRIADKQNLKGFVAIKDENIVNSILCNNIEKIEFQESESESGTLNIYFKNGYWLRCKGFSKEVFLTLIDSKMKEKATESLIEVINVKNLENHNSKVTIRGENFFLENAQITDKDLLEMFELKD